LIADEPTTALDVTVQKTILALLNQLREKYEMSLLFVTHDLGIVSEIAENILVMHQGEIVEQGTTLKILDSPENDYTKGLIACRPPLNEKPYRLKTIDQFISKESVEKKSVRPEKNRDIPLEPLLEIKNLTTEFVSKRNLWGTPLNKLIALNNVSFTVYKGETLGVVGESGCGKTTLGRTILRLIDQASGQVYYQGVEISKLTQKQFRNFRKQLQIIFQNPFSSLNPKLTVGEALMEPMIFHGILKNNKERKQRVLELLKKVKLLEEHFDRFPHEFSGGQRQRIGIARALCVEPEIIICDESVSSLDVSVQARVLNLLNDLKDEFGLTYIFISHDLSVVKYMCDRVLVMSNGQIEETGEPDKIFLAPASEVTKKLVNSIPGVEIK
jgi:peptide/nickel transport system ATP-binding protein